MRNFDANLAKILLVGDVSRVFPQAAAVRQLPCVICADILDAIDAADKNNFTVIAVVMSSLCPKLDSALRTLRGLNTEAKIVLLAQMSEEPLAMQLVGSVSNGVSMADDYLICPIQAARFYEVIMSPQGRQPAEIAAPPTVDVNREMRIKELEKLATEDDLTGLKNRRYI